MFLKEGLQLDGASLKVLKQTVKMGVITSPSSSYCFPLSQLEWLCLEEVNNSFLCASIQYGQWPKRIKRKEMFQKLRIFKTVKRNYSF